MGDYYDHYLKKGVLLLADVFENAMGCDVKSDWCKVRKNIKH